MKLREDQARLQGLLKETVTVLCKNGLPFIKGFVIDALIGITTDENETFLIKLEETVGDGRDENSNCEDEADGERNFGTSRKRRSAEHTCDTPAKRQRDDSSRNDVSRDDDIRIDCDRDGDQNNDDMKTEQQDDSDETKPEQQDDSDEAGVKDEQADQDVQPTQRCEPDDCAAPPDGGSFDDIARQSLTNSIDSGAGSPQVSRHFFLSNCSM